PELRPRIPDAGPRVRTGPGLGLRTGQGRTPRGLRPRPGEGHGRRRSRVDGLARAARPANPRRSLGHAVHPAQSGCPESGRLPRAGHRGARRMGRPEPGGMTMRQPIVALAGRRGKGQHPGLILQRYLTRPVADQDGGPAEKRALLDAAIRSSQDESLGRLYARAFDRWTKSLDGDGPYRSDDLKT